MENKIWKDITGFYNYQISDKSEIKTYEGKIMLSRKKKRGYHIITLLSDIKEVRTVMPHRIAALIFLEDNGINPDGTVMKGNHQVNHKDGNKDNNSIDNLEWCD